MSSRPCVAPRGGDRPCTTNTTIKHLAGERTHRGPDRSNEKQCKELLERGGFQFETQKKLNDEKRSQDPKCWDKIEKEKEKERERLKKKCEEIRKERKRQRECDSSRKTDIKPAVFSEKLLDVIDEQMGETDGANGADGSDKPDHSKLQPQVSQIPRTLAIPERQDQEISTLSHTSPCIPQEPGGGSTSQLMRPNQEWPILSCDNIAEIEEKLNMLHHTFEILDQMPTTESLVERTKSKTQSTPIVDMWHIFNLNKRMCAAEGCIEKLSAVLEKVIKDTSGLKDTLAAISNQLEDKSYDDKMEFEKMSVGQRVRYLKKRNDCLMKFMNCIRAVGNLEELCAKLAALPAANKLKSLLETMQKLEKDVKDVKKLVSGENHREIVGVLSEVQSQIGQLVVSLSKTTLTAGNNHRHASGEIDVLPALKVMAEEIEFLKTTKADQEQIEQSLEQKIDEAEMKRVVSQINATVEHVMRRLEEVYNRLSTQESLLVAALDETQKELDNKLDKKEIEYLKDFVNCKLRSIHDKLKELSQLRRTVEAAGAKSLFLTNLNCISCDADVVMARENQIRAAPPAMPPATKPLSPHITYELDLLRNGKKCNGRNLDEIDGLRHKSTSQTGEKERFQAKEEHISNRYCGGSHTMTTPLQRVPRVSNVLQDLGIAREANSPVWPEVPPLRAVSAPGESRRPSSPKKTKCPNSPGSNRPKTSHGLVKPR